MKNKRKHINITKRIILLQNYFFKKR